MDSNKIKTSDAQLRANRNYHAKKRRGQREDAFTQVL